MGAALMSTPDRAVAILTSLVKNLRIPVSAKIRCYSDTQKTVDFAKRLEATGISALAIHGRLKTERPRHPCRYETIKAVSAALTIPVLSNGGSNYFTDLAGIHKFQAETNTAGVLVARAAMWNPSIFDEKGPLEMETVVKEYVTIAMKYNFGYELMKYNILNIMRGEQQHDERGLTTRQALTSWQIAAAWGIEVEENEGIAMKRRKIDIFPYEKSHHKINQNWPKQSLEKFCKANVKHMAKPVYTNVRREADSRYQSTLKLCIQDKEKQFTGGWERNKREAEQAAALQAVLELCLMSYSECNIKNMTDKVVDETAWRDEIKMWNCKE